VTSGHVVLANGIAQDSQTGQKVAAVVSHSLTMSICTLWKYLLITDTSRSDRGFWLCLECLSYTLTLVTYFHWV